MAQTSSRRQTTTRARRAAPVEAPDVHLEARQIVAEMRQRVAAGEEHWLIALLDAVRRWPLAQEEVGERTYSYLIGGEAFDWLLLAERLCDELEGLAPEDEVEALLFHARLPLELTDEEFRRYLGAAKHRAHLNFLYGVRVEEALQLAVREEVHKERLSLVWENGHVDDEVYSRLYGSTRRELLEAFRQARRGHSQRPLPSPDQASLSELTEFTYWLFRRRVNNHDPARVASDTRKGLAQMERLEARRARQA